MKMKDRGMNMQSKKLINQCSNKIFKWNHSYADLSNHYCVSNSK